MRTIAILGLIAVAVASQAGIDAARAGDGKKARPPTKMDLRLRLEEGAAYEYTYTETSLQKRPEEESGRRDQSCRSEWKLRMDVHKTLGDGSVELDIRWLEIRGEYNGFYGKKEFLLMADTPQGARPGPGNTRGYRLAAQIGKPARVTVSARGEVIKVGGAVRRLMDGQENPLAEAELAVMFQRLFARLPEPTVRTGATWEATRLVAPEFVVTIDMTALGVLTEKFKITKVTAAHALVSVSAKGRERKAKKKKKKGVARPPMPKGRKQTHPVGTLSSWKVTAKAQIDHRTGLLVSRTEKVEVAGRTRWYTGLVKEVTLTSEVTVECRRLPPEDK